MTSFDLRAAPFVLLDDSRAPHRAGTSLLFHSPSQIIKADTFEEVPTALDALDKAHENGLHTAGWIAYEVGGTFEPRLAKRLNAKTEEPLIWMMVTQHREQLSHKELTELFHSAARGNRRRADIKIGEPTHNRSAYLEAIAQVQRYIQAGDVYQINHTFPLPVEVAGDTLALYQKLRASQPVPYGAYIDTGNAKVLSLSPELFIEKSGELLTARPMKGTAPRGNNVAEDEAASDFLQHDTKSRAENLMIVDLIRNDLSRIAAPASVKAERLFETERYPTLFQMTSTVTAKAKNGLTPSKLLAAMFPCGSVTGAPKVRAMEIINDLEDGPRGIYCGTIGHFSPATDKNKESWTLNVPIRTLCLTPAGKGRLNIGSGIVADSDPEAEHAECLLKSRFARTTRPDFSLIETLRLEGGHYRYLNQHMERLISSARYFDFECNPKQVELTLEQHAEDTVSNDARRCRLLLDKYGHCSVTSTELQAAHYTASNDYRDFTTLASAGTVCLSPTPVTKNNLFLRHKTTHRSVYDNAFKAATKAGHLDVLFLNDDDNVTEGAVSNIFIVKDDCIITPPTCDGLLDGIQRGDMIETIPAPHIHIRSINVSELFSAEIILIGNAVRGLRRVILAE